MIDCPGGFNAARIKKVRIAMKPLEGILVIDMTQFMSGPLCTMTLSDLGADVIKFERPPVGDTSRYSPPGKDGASSYFISLNRNKKSVLLNLKDPAQKQAFLEIVKKADILVENFKPGTMEKFGCGYDSLKEINPRLVYGAISGYGQTGPLSKKGAYDLVIQAESGLMSITGERGGQPLKTGTSSSDLIAGLFMTIGILGALRKAQMTGEGDYVDVAMLDASFASLENAVSRYLLTGIVPKPLGNRHPSSVPFQPFDTSDGKLFVCCISDANWYTFARAIGRDDLADDERFKTMNLRNRNIEILDSLVQEELNHWTTADLIKALDAAGVVNGQINTIDKACEMPQILARDMIMNVSFPGAKKPLQTSASPIKMRSYKAETNSYCPQLGENTVEVMTKLGGMTEEQVQEVYKDIFPAVEETVKAKSIY